MQTDPADAALDAVLARLNTALGNKEIDAVAGLFQDECYWRDLVLFSWNLRTLEGRDQIREMLTQQLSQVEPRHEPGTRLWPHPRERRQDLDAADHHVRTEGA
ncbi:hypothetical protein G6F40_012982 [Rhizopus arrhizus]|nr:hypothetical protein G6F40_012982 [Rhizopus arrhizus]